MITRFFAQSIFTSARFYGVFEMQVDPIHVLLA